MHTDGEPAPRDPQQFSLQAALVALTLFSFFFAAVRSLHAPHPWSFIRLTEAVVVIAMLTGALYRLVGMPIYDSPLVGGWIASIGGGAIFNAAHAAVFSVNGTVGFFMHVMLGIVWYSIFSVVGVTAAWLIDLMRKKPDGWSGIICGTVTGTVGFSAALFDTSHVDNYAAASFVALYGGWGAAMQMGRSRQRRERRDFLPQNVDATACATAELQTSRWYRVKKRVSFRMRKVLALPSRISRS